MAIFFLKSILCPDSWAFEPPLPCQLPPYRGRRTNPHEFTDEYSTASLISFAARRSGLARSLAAAPTRANSAGEIWFDHLTLFRGKVWSCDVSFDVRRWSWKRLLCIFTTSRAYELNRSRAADAQWVTSCLCWRGVSVGLELALNWQPDDTHTRGAHLSPTPTPTPITCHHSLLFFAIFDFKHIWKVIGIMIIIILLTVMYARMERCVMIWHMSSASITTRCFRHSIPQFSHVILIYIAFIWRFLLHILIRIFDRRCFSSRNVRRLCHAKHTRIWSSWHDIICTKEPQLLNAAITSHAPMQRTNPWLGVGLILNPSPQIKIQYVFFSDFCTLYKCSGFELKMKYSNPSL